MKIMLGFLAVLLSSGCASSAYSPGMSPMLRQAQSNGLSLVLMRSSRREEWRRVAVLTEPWFYCASKAGQPTGELYAVPPGYETDFASIPGFARAIVSPFGGWAEAAVIHDWLYDVGENGKRNVADDVMELAMKEQDVGGWSRFVILTPVRLFGGFAYEKAERRDEAYWNGHFVDRLGNLKTPPFAQPEQAMWKPDFPCAKLDSSSDVKALVIEYYTQYPQARW